MNEPGLQYLSDEHGDLTGVVVPISLWRQISAELETQYLLKSPAMRDRLLGAIGRGDVMPIEEVFLTLGIDEPTVQ